MDKALIQHTLIDHQMTLLDLSRRAAIPYDRLIKLVNGHRLPRGEEVHELATVLDVAVEAIHPGISFRSERR